MEHSPKVQKCGGCRAHLERGLQVPFFQGLQSQVAYDAMPENSCLTYFVQILFYFILFGENTSPISVILQSLTDEMPLNILISQENNFSLYTTKYEWNGLINIM